MKKSGGGPSASVKSPAKRRRVGFQAEGEPSFLLATDCIKLHLVSRADDVQQEGVSTSGGSAFSPVYIHRYFGEDGRIYGYRGLKIDVWIHAASLHVYADIQFESKNQTVAPGRFTTDIREKLKDMFKFGLVQSREEFIHNFSVYSSSFEEMRKNHGELVADFREPDLSGDDAGTRCEIARFKILNKEVREWQERMSSLALLFIDGASEIDVKDPRWEIYVCIQPPAEKQRKVASLKVIGSATVYNFYRHPESTRLRLSQILVLPSYQGKGYGRHLLETLNASADNRGCFDVTMEDPSESLQTLRESMDVLRLISFDPAKSALKEAISRIQSHVEHSISGGENAGDQCSVTGVGDVTDAKGVLLPPSSFVERARSTFKISKTQLRRCWEVLLYLCLPSSDAVGNVFKQLLVSRLTSEIVGKAKMSEKGNRRKCVIDTFNEYGNDRTFVMLPVLPQEAVAVFKAHAGDDEENVAYECPPGEEEGKPDPAKVKEAVEALLKDREEELETVARRVCLWCESRGDQLGGIDTSLFLKANFLIER